MSGPPAAWLVVTAMCFVGVRLSAATDPQQALPLAQRYLAGWESQLAAVNVNYKFVPRARN